MSAEAHSFPAGAACVSGIDVNAPVQIAISGLAGTSLPPGTYRMRLKLADNVRLQVDSREVAPGSEAGVKTSDGKVRFTLSSTSGSVRVYEVTLEARTAP